MGIFRDIVTAIKGGASEVGEAIVDSQAMRILEQEIREAQNGIQKAKQSLSKLKAQEISLAKELSIVNADIDRYTDKAKQALEKDRDLALKIAEKVQELNERKVELDDQKNSLESQVNKIYKVIQQREKQIEKNKIELQKAKTYADLQKTQQAVRAAMLTGDSNARRVKRAMDRVKKQQAETENQMDADQWLADMEKGADLDAEISAAGLGDSKSSSAEDFLASLEAGKK